MESAKLIPKKCQIGAATLMISVLILLLATVIVIGVSRTTLMEQRMSANEKRARETFEAAQAGLEHGLEYLTTPPANEDNAFVCRGIDRNCDNTADTLNPVAQATGASYRVSFCDPTSSAAVSCPDAIGAPNCDLLDGEFNDDGDGNTSNDINEAVFLNIPLIVSCAWSDDQIGRQLIRQETSTVPTLGAKPTAPLISKGAINVQGSATVTNYYTNLTIWSGGALINIGNSGKTFVRYPTLPPPEIVPTPPGSATQSTCGSGGSEQCYVEVTNKDIIGPDIIMSDPTLANLSDARMFENYLGVENVDAYRSTVASKVLAPDATAGLSGIRGQAVLIDANGGNVSLPNGNINTVSSYLGTRDRPVVIVIDGNWTEGNSIVFGVVYVTGNIDLSGSPEVYGAVIVEGSVQGTGGLNVLYDPYAVSNANSFSGKPGLRSGTWRDW
ncbi:MAG: pilus assembly PilX N-terminal domain-containing protein [Lamprobacter sp.]|uniref:pilus assembly PilX family protein n=1 Tax=Lamprobacter sp. TaxID=3100796 RepID=UPI002B263BF7|nr:pilus assembly PilX N-terminal domain-containing protein [Lamprobacter sp.]MEA3638502.1 pilus assembly PilX N-terminal domain-containing protein [Lamprobacter sp.]